MVQLTPRVFEILLILVRNSGRLVTKEELMKEVWADRFVEEGNLTQSISVLRKALQERPGQPQFIETVPRRGYRFIAPVREVRSGQDEVIIEERTQARVFLPADGWNNRRAATRRFLLPTAGVRNLIAPPVILSGLAVVCLAAWMFYVRSRPQVTGLRAGMNAVSLRTMKSREGQSYYDARFSPDGNRIAYVIAGQNFDIRVLELSSGRDWPLTSESARDESPVWSPDGREIAFVSDRQGQLGIWAVSETGEGLRSLLALSSDTSKPGSGMPALRGWKGSRIYYDWNHNLYALDVTSNRAEKLTNFDPEKQTWVTGLSPSPDGQWIAYADYQQGRYDLWVAPAAGGSPVQITSDPAADLNPVWDPDGSRIVYYKSQGNGQDNIFIVPRTGGDSVQLTFDENRGRVTDLSPDGQSLLLCTREEQADLWAVEVGSGESRRVTADVGFNCWPSVSSDGRWLAFQKMDGERVIWNPEVSSLVIRPLNGEGQAVTVAGSFEAQWAQGHDAVAFLRSAGDLFSLYVRSLSGNERRVADGLFYYGFTFRQASSSSAKEFRWSGDGKSLAYCSSRDGFPNVYVVGADGSGDHRISAHTFPKASVYDPVWSADNSRIAWIFDGGYPPDQGRQTRSIWISDSGTVRPLVAATGKPLRLVGWTQNDELVVAELERPELSPGLPNKVLLKRLTLNGSVAAPPIELSSVYFTNLQLSPDRRNVSAVFSLEGRENIFVVPLDGSQRTQITRNDDGYVYLSATAWSPDGRTIYYGRQTKLSLLKILNSP
ncbi:MAG TPA: winged helix-turn-helix domain-containing protein [Blastocatellia bacterium]|nr:winged helix-turn-helix domain-containing protein [Blastocatellia bacterium]